MNVREIPKFLFDEFSKNLGVGEVKKIGDLLVRKLENECAIGFRQNAFDEKTFFTVWPYFPEIKSNSSCSYSLQIMAGFIRTGTWSYGRGNLMQEAITADFPIKALDLSEPVVQVIVLVLARAVALAQSPILPKEQFWEAQRKPDGDYQKP